MLKPLKSPSDDSQQFNFLKVKVLSEQHYLNQDPLLTFNGKFLTKKSSLCFVTRIKSLYEEV